MAVPRRCLIASVLVIGSSACRHASTWEEAQPEPRSGCIPPQAQDLTAVIEAERGAPRALSFSAQWSSHPAPSWGSCSVTMTERDASATFGDEASPEETFTLAPSDATRRELVAWIEAHDLATAMSQHGSRRDGAWADVSVQASGNGAEFSSHSSGMVPTEPPSYRELLVLTQVTTLCTDLRAWTLERATQETPAPDEPEDAWTSG